MLIFPTASSRTHKGDPLAGAKLKGRVCKTWVEDPPGSQWVDSPLETSLGALPAPAALTGPVTGALGHQQADSHSAEPSWPLPHLVGGPGLVTCAEGDFCLFLGARLLRGVHLNV